VARRNDRLLTMDAKPDLASTTTVVDRYRRSTCQDEQVGTLPMERCGNLLPFIGHARRDRQRDTLSGQADGTVQHSEEGTGVGAEVDAVLVMRARGEI
jgi:hypothetical protein